MEVLVSYHGISKLTIAKMAGVEEQDIDRLLANPPEKVEIEVKYKIAVTVMELRFWLRIVSYQYNHVVLGKLVE